jgi:hypothetical protein
MIAVLHSVADRLVEAGVRSIVVPGPASTEIVDIWRG